MVGSRPPPRASTRASLSPAGKSWSPRQAWSAFIAVTGSSRIGAARHGPVRSARVAGTPPLRTRSAGAGANATQIAQTTNTATAAMPITTPINVTGRDLSMTRAYDGVCGSPSRSVRGHRAGIHVVVGGLCVRLLHDTDRSGFWILAALFVPFVNLLVLYFFAIAGTPGSKSVRPQPVWR